MSAGKISYSDIPYFSALVKDYLSQSDSLKPFYHRFPNLKNLGEQLEEKKKSYTPETRRVLVEVLKEQYQDLTVSQATRANIDLLAKEHTYTVTTGHQLNLFTGPLYFLYKIISAINLATELKQQYPDQHFVPVYWMATEDHDFEEINFFHLHGKKFQWNPPPTARTGGAVGELPTEGLEDVYALFAAEVGNSVHARKLKEWFRKAYLEHKDLATATRYLADQLFSEYGLVILDANHRKLKQQFGGYMKRELLERSAYETTVDQARNLQELGYPVQVNPREINLFYLDEGIRERIVEDQGRFFVHDSSLSWSEKEILGIMEKQPEKFSPNVIMRPLYQEVILPNLCYIGGGGELAYWFELKTYFEKEKIPFPILLLRNSALVQTKKQDKKRQRLNITVPELFLKDHELINRKVRQISNIDIDLSPQRAHLKRQFEQLYELAEKTDPTFLGAVKAQEVKQLKGLDLLEKRLLRAQKRKLSDEVSRITALQNELFPNKSLQERQLNFSELYLEYGDNLIPMWIQELKPLESKFLIFSL